MQIVTTACLALLTLCLEREVKPAPAGSPPPAKTPAVASPAPTKRAAATKTVPTRVAPAFRVDRDGPVAAAKVTVIDSSKIYYGDAKTSTTPAVIVSQRVWDQIPEYLEIKRKGLTEADLEYWVLLKKASAKFQTAVKRGAKATQKDLVAEDGAIEVKGESIPDVTAAVIAELP